MTGRRRRSVAVQEGALRATVHDLVAGLLEQVDDEALGDASRDDPWRRRPPPSPAACRAASGLGARHPRVAAVVKEHDHPL